MDKVFSFFFPPPPNTTHLTMYLLQVILIRLTIGF